MHRRHTCIALIPILLLLLACGSELVGSYVLTWNTSAEIRPETATVVVAGGDVYDSSTNQRRDSGSIEVVAPAACVKIVWHATLKTGGTAAAMYYWDYDCSGAFIEHMIYIPTLQVRPRVIRKGPRPPVE